MTECGEEEGAKLQRAEPEDDTQARAGELDAKIPEDEAVAGEENCGSISLGLDSEGLRLPTDLVRQKGMTDYEMLSPTSSASVTIRAEARDSDFGLSAEQIRMLAQLEAAQEYQLDDSGSNPTLKSGDNIFRSEARDSDFGISDQQLQILQLLDSRRSSEITVARDSTSSAVSKAGPRDSDTSLSTEHIHASAGAAECIQSEGHCLVQSIQQCETVQHSEAAATVVDVQQCEIVQHGEAPATVEGEFGDDNDAPLISDTCSTDANNPGDPDSSSDDSDERRDSNLFSSRMKSLTPPIRSVTKALGAMKVQIHKGLKRASTQTAIRTKEESVDAKLRDDAAPEIKRSWTLNAFSVTDNAQSIAGTVVANVQSAASRASSAAGGAQAIANNAVANVQSAASNAAGGAHVLASGAAGSAKKVASKAGKLAIDMSTKITVSHRSERSEATMDLLYTWFSNVRLFQALPRKVYALLVAACTPVHFHSGTAMVTQGEYVDAFYLIRMGEATVTESSSKRTVLRKGDYFGEEALLRSVLSSATITANVPVSALKITREKFWELGLHETFERRTRRKGVIDGQASPTKCPSLKNEAEQAFLKEAFQQNENLNMIFDLDDAFVQQMVTVAVKEKLSAGSELSTDCFHVVQDGMLDIFVTRLGPSAGSELELVGSVTGGSSLGELSLLYLAPCTSIVKAKTDANVWGIDRLSFKNILMEKSRAKYVRYMEYLDQVKIFAPLLDEEKRSLSAGLVEMTFTKGEAILQEGDDGNMFYILYEGDVIITVDGAETETVSADASHTIFLLEDSVMRPRPCAVTVTVSSSTARTLSICRTSFNVLLGPHSALSNLVVDDAHRIKTIGSIPCIGVHPSEESRSSSKEAREPKRRRDLKDLVRIGLLGCGRFGAVQLMEHKRSGETYALKGVSKGFMVKMGLQETVLNERNVLLTADSPFIVKLYRCYKSKQTLFFLMEPVLGGDLRTIYYRNGLHCSEDHAKFYSAGTVLALQHCHQRRIIYRDLKPENVLLDANGQLKLTDMGVAKIVDGKTYTTCGTPEYFAPEVITSSGQTVALDWWMQGIFVFELMSGCTPFESEYPIQIFSKVMKGISIGDVRFKLKNESLCDLVTTLLKREPTERLPMRPKGPTRLMGHLWYSGYDWETLRLQAMDPPFKPLVRSKTDISNFSSYAEDMPPQIFYSDDNTGWDNDFAT